MEKPEKQLHNHNSIPGYFDGLDEGCSICIENKAITLYDKYLEEREVDEGKIQTMIGNTQDCPYCPNQGWYEISEVDGPEQQQCQWCYETPNSKFNLAAALAAALKRGELWK